MITPRDTPLRQALRQAAALPEPRPADTFWQDFKARTALTGQETPGRLVVVGGSLLSRHWVLAAAAALVVVGLAFALLRPTAAPLQTAQMQTPQAPALSSVQEVEVLSEYSSVMIVEDIENGGTVIWVASAGP